VRYQTTPRFDSDYKALKPEHKAAFREVLDAFIAACDTYAERPGSSRWPKGLRVSPMKSAPGIWEMTWSFASPDGRATFEWVTDEQGLLLRWRRIGDHSIYHDP
jgi:hypothetical protein